ncbi:cation efflux system protein CusB precursor [mine drainage metagenome]|uniref:Cation efflux system protein CusB n=1 Tax=mine drainage metagenome TaxID=410659 RepID=A0A1J5T2C7_9ZZZZ
MNIFFGEFHLTIKKIKNIQMKSYKIIVVFLLFFVACKTKKQETVMQVKSDTYYTCSMHPKVMLDKPGKCPICGMELIAVKNQPTEKTEEIKLSDQQIQLGNIHTDTITKSFIGDRIVLTATLNFDEMESVSVNARVDGRIDRLYFKNIGDYVNKGDKLFDMYSEELNNAKQEYIMALEKQKKLNNAVIDFNELVQSAKNKLLLWGLTENQIQQLQKNKQPDILTSFYSKSSGYITAINIKEGDYVMEGAAVLRLANLSTLWAEAQVYTSQLSSIDLHGTATVQIPDIPGKEIQGTISFVNPEINPDTRINLIRITIPNTNNQLKPGMPAYVFINNTKKNVLTLPVDAVLRNAGGAMVWVQTEKNTFKTKMVELGLETDNRVEIKSGLSKDDIVVTQGVYLLNSEYIFKKGINPMEGMKM